MTTKNKMKLYTVQFSLSDDYYNKDKPIVTMIQIDVFANSNEEANDLATLTLAIPEHYTIDSIDEN